jgi:hypothetical protein
MASWGNDGYLDQQRRRLPTHKFRRLHLNLPGAPDGAAYSADAVMPAIVTGRKRLGHEPGRSYSAFVDMSGGSSDDAVLAISHYDAERNRAVLDLLSAQTGKPPFSPRDAIRKFVGLLAEYGVARVHGDAYAGLTFRTDFEQGGVAYSVAPAKSVLYDALEPKLNAGEIELLDITELQEQLLTLIIRGGKIDHQSGDHDDYANAAAGAIYLVTRPQQSALIAMPLIVELPRGDPHFASGERIRSFTIITTQPNTLCAELHNRMPARFPISRPCPSPGDWPVRSHKAACPSWSSSIRKSYRGDGRAVQGPESGHI